MNQFRLISQTPVCINDRLAIHMWNFAAYLSLQNSFHNFNMTKILSKCYILQHCTTLPISIIITFLRLSHIWNNQNIMTCLFIWNSCTHSSKDSLAHCFRRNIRFKLPLNIPLLYNLYWFITLTLRESRYYSLI